MKRLDARTASCFVFTFKEGLLSAVAHDLKLSVSRFTVELADDGAAIEARFDAASLRVVSAMRDQRELPTALSARDRRTIESNLSDDVLHARRHPEIVFRSTAIARDQDRATLDGELSLHGRTRPLRLAATRTGGEWKVETRLHQPDFGITPYTALLGTLRVAPHVVIRLSFRGD